MGRKSQTQLNFDTEKSEWYYQPKIYVNREDSGSLYDDLTEFRLSLSEDVENDVINENFKALFDDDYDDDELRKTAGPPNEESPNTAGLNSMVQEPGPFFDSKLELLKAEIEDINRNISIRVKIHKCGAQCIESELKILRNRLHELYTWTTGDKATVETVRMELTRQLCALNREKRASKLNLWKDKVFEKRDRRQLLFEYKSLSWTNDLTLKNGKENDI